MLAQPLYDLDAARVRSELFSSERRGVAFVADISTRNATDIGTILAGSGLGFVSFNEVIGRDVPANDSDLLPRVREVEESGRGVMLATDHAPHAAHEKEVEFDQAPCGISGLDTALAATWGLVRAGRLSFGAFLRAWTTAPCGRFGLPVNTFAPGDPADFVLLDQDREWTVDAASMKSKSKNTPLYGRLLRGRVAAHFLAGKSVVENIPAGKRPGL